MTILLLKGYNNYFNRILKQETTITDYKTKSTSYLEYPSVNFDMQDGITTSLVVGSEGQLDNGEILKFDDLGTPDYLIVHDNTDINSRWFVLESVKIRSGQYKLALKRDVLADFYKDYVETPCYVEKGFVNDIYSPLLYASEGSVVNEIKQNETLIKDWSKCAWLVGYMKKDATATVSGTLSKDLSKYTSANALPFKDCIQYVENGEVVQTATKTCVANDGSLMMYFKIYDSPRYFHNGRMYAECYANTKPFKFYDSSNNNWHGVNTCAFTGAETGSAIKATSDDQYRYHRDRLNEAYANNATFRNKFNSMINVCSAEVFTQNALVQVSDILTYEGRLVQKDSKVYKLHVDKSTAISNYEKMFTFNNVSAGDTAGLAFFTEAANQIASLSLRTVNPTLNKFTFSYEANTYLITATETTVPETITATIPAASSRRTTNDAVFDIFAIPYNPDPSVAYQFKYKNTAYTLDNEVSLLMANLLITELGLGDAGNAYDLQLLPYCPIKEYERYGYPISCGYGSDKTFSVIEDANHKAYSFICFPSESNFTTNIPFEKNYKHVNTGSIVNEWNNITATWNDDGLLYMCEVPFTDLQEDAYDLDFSDVSVFYNGEPMTFDVAYGFLGEPTLTFWLYTEQQSYGNTISVNIDADIKYKFKTNPTPLEMKVNNECDFLRLTSPNYNGMFQFKLSRLQDGIHYINADCTYKPVNPYIKLNPDFSFLYGGDYNDATGLILGGDFSLPLLTDPWNQYELANKNYQNIFNRAIQNLDINQRIAREQQDFQGIVGTLTGGIGGAGAGAYAGFKMGGGSPYGAAIGAAVGAVAGTTLGAVGYAKDKEWLREQQGEARSFTQDNYTYQLGSIQALPQSASKSSPLTYNNKVWPILEEFSCTDAEKEIIRNKIIFDGMSIKVISTLSQFSSSEEVDKVFVKGQLIRCEDIEDDFHIVDALYQEVDKGFYIKGE